MKKNEKVMHHIPEIHSVYYGLLNLALILDSRGLVRGLGEWDWDQYVSFGIGRSC